jgi:hypothetical protein
MQMRHSSATMPRRYEDVLGEYKDGLWRSEGEAPREPRSLRGTSTSRYAIRMLLPG